MTKLSKKQISIIVISTISLICVILVVLGIVFKNNLKKIGKKQLCDIPKKTKLDKNSLDEFKIISTQCLLGALKNPSKIIVVNVLSEKGIPYLIQTKDQFDNRSITKSQFETLLKENKGQIPNNINLLIIMCAAWSCGAAKNYYNELIERNVNVSRVLDYAGGFHEWAVYNKFSPDTFKLYNFETNKLALEPEINELRKSTAHTYLTNTIKKAQANTLMGNICSGGDDLPTIFDL